MKTIKYVFLFLLFFSFSCKKAGDDNAMSTIGSSLGNYNNKEITTVDPANYEGEALEILERGKMKLQSTLPFIIQDQVELYKITLESLSEQAVLTYSLDETNERVLEIKTEAIMALLDDELVLNQIYYEMINELYLLNLKYAEFLDPINNQILLDYYDVAPFVFSEDILLKINELIIDEIARVKKEKKDVLIENMVDGLEIALVFATFIPGIGQVTGVLYLVLKGLRTVNKGGEILKNSSKLSKVTSNILDTKISNRTVSKHFEDALSNEEKRVKWANRIRNGMFNSQNTAIAGGAMTYNEISTARNFEQVNKIFKSSENKIEGRIGDFSDGIITQPIGNLRKMIDHNSAILTGRQKRNEAM